MYTEGVADLNEMIIVFPMQPPGVRETKLAEIKDKAKNRYFPAFEKVSGNLSIFKEDLFI